MTIAEGTHVLRLKKNLTLGRDPSNDIQVEKPASCFHAVIEWQAGSWYVTDLQTEYGTFLNSKRLKSPRLLRPGDKIHIGSSQFIFNLDESLTRIDDKFTIRLDVLNLNHKVGKTTLLRNISLSILPQEFVAIVGASGAGKTTLLNALCGLSPASQGRVLLNNYDFYRNLEVYRSDLGYVPQEDIIHKELTVMQALDYSARLRLSADVTPQERRQRIDAVLADLELGHRRHASIKQLSGGERKRVSIGVELLTQPNLFFLDEATSGLDPGMETQMMRLLRRLADQGRTVILITHATKNVMLCDQVAFLTQGGRIAFWGPPAEALTYFGVQDFDEIYLLLEREVPEQRQQQYLASEHHQQYVTDRQRVIEQTETRGKLPQPRRRVSIWRQWWILTQRNLTVLRRDRASLILMLLVAPILGVAEFAVWSSDVFDTTDGNPADAFTMLFVIVLVAVLVGNLSMMREIVREADIYRRERMIGLRLLPYISSKVCLGVVLSLYQASIFLSLKLLSVDFGVQDLATGLKMFLTLFFVTLAAMIMGLLVSALASSQNVAPLLTILFIVPQITFSGVLVPLGSLGPGANLVSKLTITRWGHETMVTLSGVGQDIAADHCWQMTEAKRDNLTESEKQQCDCLGPNLFTQCRFPGIGGEYHPAVDQPEPKQPKQPGEAPEFDPFDQNLQQSFEDYSDRVDAYTKAMDTWQDQYGDWKENRGRAIASGEALIRRYTEAEGRGYDVNVPGHWGRLGLVSLGMLTAITVMQKRKDR